MGTPGPSSEVTLEDALGIFGNLDEPSTPLTATDAAEELNCTRRAAERKLEELSERNDLGEKQLGTDSRVWWRPTTDRDGDDQATSRRSELEEFGDFVTAVEDYAIFTLDADGRVATWNEGARRIKGYEKAEIVGEHFSEFYTEGDVEAGVPEENLAAATEEGRIEDEGWRVRADGMQFWANVVITAIEDDDGELKGYTKVTRDMTERREYEQRLERERNRTEELLKTAPIPIGVQDGEGETVMANERAQEALGLSESEIAEGPEDEDEWTLYDGNGDPIEPSEGPAAQVLETGEPVYEEEVAIEDPSGERTWFSINAVPFTSPDGDEDGVVVAAEDVTALKERQRELETELSEVLGRVSDAFYALDDECRFTHVNERATTVLQHTREELLGESIWEVFPQAKESPIWDEFWEAFESQESRSFEEYYEGIDRWLEFTVYPSETGLSVYFQDVTDRKERERELAKYETIVETIDDGIYVKDEDGRFTMVNEAYAEMTGYGREELVGAHASLVVDEGTMEESRERIGDGADMPMEAPIETADGDSVPAEGTFASLETGEEVGVVRDVTQRKEAQQQLEEERDMFAEGPAVVFRWGTDADAGWPVEYVSENVEDVLGYTPEELKSDDIPYTDLLLDEELDRIASEVEEANAQGAERFTHEPYRIRTKDGDVRWVKDITKIVRDDSGDVDHYLGYLVDITERKEHERELAQYETIVETVNDGIYVVDEDGHFTTVNEAYAGMLGYDREELLGEHVSLVVDEDVSQQAQELEAKMAEGAVEDPVLQAELETASGDRIPSEATFAVLPTHGEDEQRRVGVARDITERKEYERELERSERRYRALVENFPNGAVALVGKDLRYRTVGGDPINDESDGPDTLEGKTVREALSPELADALEPQYEAALEGESSTFEVEQAGEVVQIQIYPVRDDDGEVFAALGMSQDVTERVEREQYLQDAKSRLEAATEAGAVGTWEWDVQEDRMTANPSFADTFGLDREEAMEGIPVDRFTSRIHEDDRERVERQIEKAVESCGEYESEYRVWNDEGRLHWVVARGHVECDDEGNPTTFPGAITDITRRKEYQRRIEESERRYRTLVENFPDGAVGLFDEDLRYTAVGGEFLDQTGIAAEERIGEKVSDIYPDELVGKVEPYFEAALDGETNSFEVEYLDRHLSAHTLPVTGGDEEVIAGMLVVQDVTERREAQRELRESEAKFRMIAENLEEIVWMTTPDAEEFLYVNPAFEDVWGTDRERLYDDALSFLDSVHPEDRDRVEEQFAALPEEEFDAEYRVVQPDGEIRWVHSRGGLVHDEDSEMARIVGIGNDVTERVERERELERALDLLEKTERIADVGGWELDPETEEVFWSDYLFGILDVDAEEEPPLDEALDVYHEEDRPLVASAIEEALETGEPLDVEVRFHTGSGELRWLRVQGEPETDDGEVVSLRGAAQDVTERVERERELEELVDQLEKSNERLERFAYVASHDLQEPLRMISNYLQLLEQRYRDELDSDAEEFIDFAVDGAERMRDMIDDLLAYSRLDTEAGPFEPTDGEAIVENVLDDLQLRIEETDARVTVGELPTVDVDANQFEMVVQNLVSNAMKYSGDDPPRIEIGADRRDDEWVFHVEDDGIGMDPEHADDVFEVFNRLHAHEEYPGTGIGLAMCKKIVHHHGGRIWVESEPGEGSTFYFTIPAEGDGGRH